MAPSNTEETLTIEPFSTEHCWTAPMSGSIVDLWWFDAPHKPAWLGDPRRNAHDGTAMGGSCNHHGELWPIRT